MNDTIKPPATFDSIPVGGGPASVLDIPRAAPPKPLPRQTMPVPPLPEPPAPPKPVLPVLPAGIAPEVPLAPDANPMPGSPPPKASIFSGLLWDLIRPNRAKVAVLAGLGSLAAGAFGLNLLVPQFTAAPQQHAKAKEPTKHVATEAPPAVAPAPLPKPPAEGGWNPIADISPPKPPTELVAPKMPGGLDLPALPTPPTEDPYLRRVNNNTPAAPAPLTPAPLTPAPLFPAEPALPALPPAGGPKPAEPLLLPLPALPGAELPKPAPPPALPGAGGLPALPEPAKPLPEVKPPEVKPLTFPASELPPLAGPGGGGPAQPGGLPLPGGLPEPRQPEVKPAPLPSPGGWPGLAELPAVPGTPKPLEAVHPKPLDLPPLPGAGGPKLEPAKPAQLDPFPGGALPPLTPTKPDPVIGAGGFGAPPAPPPAVGVPAALPLPGPAAALQPPLSESKTDFDVDIHRPAAGDTYATVSKSFYGSPQYASALQAFNRNQPINRVPEVQIPPVHVIRKYGTGPTVEQVRGEQPVRPAPAGSDEPLWGPPGASQGGQVVYTPFKVPRKGMTLRDVAKVFYGSENNWSRLNNARNPIKFHPDEELPLGTELLVPTEVFAVR